MGSLRAKIGGWLARWYFKRTSKKGFDLSKLPFLPDSLLVMLRRVGLDPVPEVAEARESEPIKKVSVLGMDVWLVTGYDEAKSILGNAKDFSNDFTNLVGSTGVSEDQNPGGLGFTDPPDHTRLRKMLTPEFTMRRLNRLSPRIDEIVEGCLDDMASVDGPVDLVKHFALPIPSLTICELLGVPYEDRAEFQRLSTTRFDLFGGAGASLDAMSESLTYLLEIVKKQRAEPGDGLLGMLVKDHGDNITDMELAGLADGLLTGGLETTASMLALGAIVLLRNENWVRQLREDDEAIGKFVEELLRYLTVVQVAFPRFPREDMEIGGVRMAKNDIVLVSLSGANRDPRTGEDLESFDPDHEAPGHLAFGWGVHRCVGAELGRMELRKAYPALVRRFPQLRLATDADELAYRELSIVYGVEELPVLLS